MMVKIQTPNRLIAMDLRILVVDRQAHMTGILVSLLRHLDFDDILVANSIKDACSLFLTNGPDLVICEEELPDGSAISFCRKIRVKEDKDIDEMRSIGSVVGGYIIGPGDTPDGESFRSKFVLVTAHPTRTLVEQCKATGVDAIMTKPISQRDLDMRLTHLFGGAIRKRAG